MSNANPYRAPSAEIADIPESGEFELAGIGHRFGAFVIDAAILAAVVVPIAYVAGIIDFDAAGEDDYIGAAKIAALAFALFAVFQSYFLKKYGQTMGKKIVGIRMVDRNGNLPGLARVLFSRYLPICIYGALPVIGTVLGIIDFLLVFRRDRRSLHDMLGGTRVVMHGAKHSSITWVIAPVFALIGGSIAISVISPMLDNPPAKPPVKAKKTVAQQTAHPAPAQTAPTHPASGKTAGVQTGGAQTAPGHATPGPAGSVPARATQTAALHPATRRPALAQALAVPAPTPAPAAPAAAAPSADTRSLHDRLRKCATLGSAAAIINCSQSVH